MKTDYFPHSVIDIAFLKICRISDYHCSRMQLQQPLLTTTPLQHQPSVQTLLLLVQVNHLQPFLLLQGPFRLLNYVLYVLFRTTIEFIHLVPNLRFCSQARRPLQSKLVRLFTLNQTQSRWISQQFSHLSLEMLSLSGLELNIVVYGDLHQVGNTLYSSLRS